MTQNLNTPLLLKPVYRSALWGGDRIAARFHRTGTPAVCSEAWEVSAHPDGCGIIVNGPHKGKRLDDLANEFGTALVGTRAPNPHRFPLLFKIIDAQQNLSVQIHPNNKNASLTQGTPKSEMWYVLDRVPGSKLYAGLKEGTREDDIRDALKEGTIASKVVELAVDPDEALYIPGGLVHAIGAGCLIYEVQQSSNTTYRFFDWNRVGADGSPRKLHIEESLKTIDWNLSVPVMRKPSLQDERTGCKIYDIVTSPYFHLRKMEIASPQEFTADGTTFRVFFIQKGSVTLTAGGESVRLGFGSSALLPAEATAYTIVPEGEDAEILITTL